MFSINKQNTINKLTTQHTFVVFLSTPPTDNTT